MKKQKEQVRPVFTYLFVVVILLVIIGILNITGHLNARATLSPESNYTREEVKSHNSLQSCWISIEREVYDITFFLQEYEGDLSSKCGKRLDEDKFPDVINQLLDEKYKIGRVK